MTTERKPNVVVIGGGTGMPVLLRGLKNYPIDLSAIVTVADDGGSSGRLRNEMAIPAPGDIRKVIAAMSDVEPMLLKLFEHRFQNGNGLSGHSMGNLLLAAMTSITGDFYDGIKEISKVLNVKGNIYPIANQNMYLHAEMNDGTIVSGESKIPNANKKIRRVFLSPDHIEPLPEAVESIRQADLIVIAPGSLYTSTLPNLIVPEIGDAIRLSEGKIVYVCNVMTQAGETDNFTAADHVQVIHDHLTHDLIDAIVVHNTPIDKNIRKVYEQENASPVTYDLERLIHMGLEIIEGDIIESKNKMLRHNTDKIAKLLHSLIM
ncbi:gluconeogenesis factor YvcK family protein [Salirhabdus salicampi]|uniref:gluconeogenesis factor YvcK family protein n=1 Tax=Salirhabdus salicampi TaxID=476102 RepID=UPI0020C30337|nr:YvcK family protein [Salirhabdus salicampi]MCP8617644.1 YvcK family protein [Salirhabdus salicampi]